jgi:alpha-tubulin suppressor-like RCC1 family protein
MTTKILGNQITNYTIDTVQLSNTATAAFAKTLAPKVLYANVASNTFTVLDDTAVNVGGGYIVVTGAEFQSGATVLIDTTPASAVTYVNSTTLQVQVPTKSAASYNLYVVNPDGGVGIKVSGVTYSSEPAWVTTSPLANQNANTAFGVNLSATGASSYSVAAGSTLPAGTTLAANGYFSGTVTIGAETTYTFSVVATDAENQDSTKTFQVTVTVTPATRLYVFGRNGNGELGFNDLVYRSSPTQVGTGTDWSIVSSGSTSFVGIKTDGTLWSWGTNGQGQSGRNDNSATGLKSSPVQVGTNTNWSFVTNTYYSVFAIKTDGTLWAWGRNSDGDLGLNDRNNRSSPTQVGTGTTWLKIGPGLYHIGVIKTDGTLWTWGRNPQGQLGQNDRISRSSPVQIGSDTNWSDIVGGQRHFIALKTNGTLWACGGDTFSGSLGLNLTSDYRSVITQIGSSTNWSSISSKLNSFATLATKTDGTLWSWGRNQFGELGINDRTYKSSPTQVGTATNWNTIAQADQVAGGIKTDGTLWLWGLNSYGQLGLNDRNYRSSPTQVGTGTNWNKLSLGRQNHSVITLN